MAKKVSKKRSFAKAQPGSSSVHVPVPLGDDEIKKDWDSADSSVESAEDKKKPAVPGAANPSQAEHRVIPVTPPAPARATTRSEGVIPPVIANLEAEVIKAGFGPGTDDDNDALGLFDMQDLVTGVDWELARTPGIDFEDAQDLARENLDSDDLYYRKRTMEADNTDDKLALTDTQKDDDEEDDDVEKDTQQTEDESTSDWPEGLNLDLASGPVREPGYLGLDLYPHDHGTVVHDLTLGIPTADGVAKNIRLVNGLQYIDGLNQDPKPLLAEIQRALMPGGEFVYEGPNELYNFPEWQQSGGIDGLQLMNHEELDREDDGTVEKIEGRPWVKQTYRRIAVPDAATANDAEPRIGIAQFDQLPADALLAMDALGYYWSDSTSSGRGNRLSGYPSQGALLSRTQENEDNQLGMAKPPGSDAKVTKSVDVESPASNLYAIPAQNRYPINDVSEAQQALQDASGRAEEQNVKDAVYRAYPELQGSPEGQMAARGIVDALLEVARMISVQKADLTTESRDHISEHNFALPADRKYPIENISHARNALARSSGKPEESKVRAAVYRKYPSLKPVQKSDTGMRRVASVAVKNGKHLLMGKRRDNGKWTMPGGHVDPDESMLEGAHRELKEETGVDAPKGYMFNLTHKHEKIGKDGKPLHVQGFLVDMQYRPKTTMKEDPDAEVHRWQWIDLAKGLPDHIAKNLHVPMEDNVVLQALGARAREPVHKYFLERTVPIAKAENRKQIAYCVVLSPEELDSQDDWMTADDIEDAAHLFMQKARAIGSEHSKLIDAQPVESYIAPQDLNWEDGPYGPQVVKKGAWVIGIKVHDPKEWAKVENGDYQGVSVGGFGMRD